MRACFLLTATLLMIRPPITAAAWAETLGDARVGFSAERVLTINGQNYIGKMWHVPGEQRHEQDLPAIKPVFILRAGSPVGDAVLPQLHTVVEFAIPKELSLFGNPDLLRNPVGEETVNGIAATKYAIDEETPSGRARGALWLSPDGIPVRCDGRFEAKGGTATTIHWELRHVRIGSQDPALFEVPHGYSKLPAEAAATLLGIRLRPASAR